MRPNTPAFIAPKPACLIAGDQVSAENLAEYQRADRTSPTATRWPRYLASLQKLRAALPPDILVLPSHNLPFYGVHERIDELAAHHERALRRSARRLRPAAERGRSCCRCCSAGRSTATRRGLRSARRWPICTISRAAARSPACKTRTASTASSRRAAD